MADVMNTHTEDGNGPPEGHDEAMLNKVAEKEAELAKVGNESPEGEKLLGKFNNAEELAKAYQELERKLSQGKNPDGEAEGDGEDKPKDDVDLNEDKATELLVKNNVDVDSMAQEFYETGELSEKSYETLEKAGIPRQFVDQYIAGVEAESANLRNQIYDEVGGEEQLAAMINWAGSNLNPQELKEYNQAVDSGDLPTVRSAVMALAYRYSRAAGSEPKLLGGNGGKASQGFESLAQLTEAMKDPRYNKDPAYRRDVEKRLASSNIM